MRSDVHLTRKMNGASYSIEPCRRACAARASRGQAASWLQRVNRRVLEARDGNRMRATGEESVAGPAVFARPPGQRSGLGAVAGHTVPALAARDDFRWAQHPGQRRSKVAVPLVCVSLHPVLLTRVSLEFVLGAERPHSQHTVSWSGLAGLLSGLLR